MHNLGSENHLHSLVYKYDDTRRIVKAQKRISYFVLKKYIDIGFI